ncbi:hypothetical protein [Rhizobium sp. BK176]|uniref:hypothetical protein n=1 Tax=Rhizobium sp. BK176 TaxID=2587071 RepID=UPI002168A45D|nr:hypothetical protein [Rhizobium sp. BK176]MCS4089264.1 hypothetical protein [Rhizobium sp. BK176]
MEIILIDDNQPTEYPSPAALGESVLVTGTLCTNNTSGGTAILEHAGTQCVVTKAFWDYETGWRYHGRVDDAAALDAFREQATTRFTPESYREKYPNNPDLYERAKKAADEFDPGYVYFSEHDLAKRG